MPDDLVYLGAFRLPEPSSGSDWNYSGMAMTFYPYGDPEGAEDGFPGSLFASGHDHHQMVSEISIPEPVISPNKNPGDLNTARTLQPFTDIKAGLHGYLELPVMGLAWHPVPGEEDSGKLYFCWGQHIQFREASHGWCSTDLSDPQSEGPWYLERINNYTSNDMLFSIPQAWADAHTSGQSIASGRFREGVWSGLGPALHAIAPWQDGNPPAAGDTLKKITTLLLYGEDDPLLPEIVTDSTQRMNGFLYADQWTGGAWLNVENASAVIFAGTKAMGKSWYGFSNGTVWPYEGPYPDYPDPPHDQRGFWADSIHAQIIFFNPDDLAQVAAGKKPTWFPQPYAIYDFTHLLFQPGYDDWNYKTHSVGACAYDPENQYVYIMERLADEDKSLVHVWQIQKQTSIENPQAPSLFHIFCNYPNPFNSGTEFQIKISSQDTDVQLIIYNQIGQKVTTLISQKHDQGELHIKWQPSNLSTGIYIAVLKINSQYIYKKTMYIQ